VLLPIDDHDCLSADLPALLAGRHGTPGRLLGPRVLDRDGAGRPRSHHVRAFLPTAQRAWLVAADPAGGRISQPMRRTHASGVYETILLADPSAGPESLPRYAIRIDDGSGDRHDVHDPYAFATMLTDYDLHLLGEGRHWKSYQKLGAQIRSTDGVNGVNFAVWAPNADAVSVIGDFNSWDGRTHQMRKHVPSGVWELFIPGMHPGDAYKYRVHASGSHSDRADPYGFGAEVPPRTASLVVDLAAYQWRDDEWMAGRASKNSLSAPINVYEVHLGSWRRPGDDRYRWLSYSDLERELIPYCVEMGFTHVELLPPTEHPLSASWGYQTIGMFAATSRFGPPQGLMSLIDAFHRAGIGVLIDWVPAHFPKDGHGLRRFDGTALYEHDDPRKGEHPDWGTLIFNYGRNEVANYLISSALFWLDHYHVDGLRVDAVASMLYLDYSRKEGEWAPNCFGGRENIEAIELIKQFNIQVHHHHPGVLTIAEESTAWAGVSRPTYVGGLGFSLKWNMGWMNDTLRYMRHDPVHRKYHHDELTFSLIYAFHENFVLPFSHDEVVHGKGSMLEQMPGDLWQKFANLRLLYAYMWCHPGKKLLFMGGEFGQWAEWNFDESLQWHLCQYDSHRGLAKAVADLNHLVRRERALHELDFDGRGFEWIDCHNWQDSVLVFVRRAADPADFLLVCCNFTPVPRPDYRIGVPHAGQYDEVFNSDSAWYGGGNVGNAGGLEAGDQPHHGREHSLLVSLPPLAAVVLKPRRSSAG
jgi:1,4-alpha-glucan branching enzyme